ncbi:MAG: hypothetical protein WBD99_08225 [Thermodesulfobacteriota bacterium]
MNELNTTILGVFICMIFLEMVDCWAVQPEKLGDQIGKECVTLNPNNQDEQIECVEKKCSILATQIEQVKCKLRGTEGLILYSIDDPMKRKEMEEILHRPKGKSIGGACKSEYHNNLTHQVLCAEQTCSNMFKGSEIDECKNLAFDIIVPGYSSNPQVKEKIDRLLVANTSTRMSGIKTRCAKKWPTDYEMQEYCINKQTEAASKLQKFIETYPEGSEERIIISRCAIKWQEGDTYDYEMVEYCSNNQIQAFQKLYK